MEKEGSLEGETISKRIKKSTFFKDDDHAVEQRNHTLHIGNTIDMVRDHIQRMNIDKAIDPTRISSSIPLFSYCP